MEKHRRLAEVSCSKVQFSPGDKLLVNVFFSMTNEEKKKLRITINKWAGCELNILIVDNTKMEITIDKRNTLSGVNS